MIFFIVKVRILELDNGNYNLRDNDHENGINMIGNRLHLQMGATRF